MVTCSTNELSNEQMLPLGSKTYETLPRIGEYIAIEEDGIGLLFEVVAVAHSSEYRANCETNGSDLYVKRLGREVDVLSQLHR